MKTSRHSLKNRTFKDKVRDLDLGLVLRQRRLDLKLTQKQVESYLNKPKCWLSGIELGHTYTREKSLLVQEFLDNHEIKLQINNGNN